MCPDQVQENENLVFISPSFSGQFERADGEGWDCNHGDGVEDSRLSDQLRVRGQDRRGFPLVHLGSVSVSLRISLDVRQRVVGEGVSDVADHGGLGDRHALWVESREVGRQRSAEVSYRVDGDVSDGLGGYLLVSGGGWSCCDGLRGRRRGARRGGDVR